MVFKLWAEEWKEQTNPMGQVSLALHYYREIYFDYSIISQLFFKRAISGLFFCYFHPFKR